MADKLTFRNNGTWAIIGFGLSCIGYWVITMLFAWGSADAKGLGIDAVAASTTMSLKGIAVGILILAIGIVMRLVMKPRPQQQ